MTVSLAAATRPSIYDSESSVPPAEQRFRRSVPGPEKDLVNLFLTSFPVSLRRNQRATVFVEPRLESGFPDLVVVVWTDSKTKDWAQERMDLTPKDLRVIQNLYHCGEQNESQLVQTHCKDVETSLDRLVLARMIRKVRGNWRPLALSRNYAISRLIAIEAKVSEWSVGLEQALLNTWFASESYILVPHIPKGSQLLERAEPLGVGVISNADMALAKKPTLTPSKHPRSYASWLFNEWVWRGASTESGS